jgi:hypothetical protein
MDSRFIIECFWQQKNNCAYVAAIKWLLISRGITGGFRIRKKGKYTVISLPDGQSWSFTSRDLARLNRNNNLGFRRYHAGREKRTIEKVKEFTRLCFAVLVSNMQLRGYEGKEYTRERAIKALTKEGIDTSWFHLLLGLKRVPSKKITLSGLPRIKKMKAILIYNSKHITVASAGLFDDFGKALPVDRVPVLLGEKATSWYTLK